jgi:4-amino-4-deoxy-L-arabinose transferase-like glycosyltransferase
VRLSVLTFAAILAYAVLLGWLLGPAGGLEGSYLVRRPDGVEVLVRRQVDPVLDFPVPQRLDAAYIFHWDLERDGFPEQMPPYLIRWRGSLQAPEEGTYRFALDARGAAALRIDGQDLDRGPTPAETRLAAGWHPIEVDYALEEGDARLVLMWQPPGGSMKTVPGDSLAVDPAAHAAVAHRRVAGWALLAAGLLAVLFVAVGAHGGRGIAGRAGAAVMAHRNPIALGAILALATLLRFHDYTLVPVRNETIDEYQHAWEGWHLLHQGIPAAWSTFPNVYPKDHTVDLRWFGKRFLLVRPYFDHPPLFSIPVGLACTLAGASQYLDCSLPAMRVVPILLSLAGLLLLHRLAITYGASERAALLAALAYAVVPLIVVSHRLVKAESLLTLLFMGAILAVESHARTGRTRDAALAGLLSGLSIWTKATGVAVVGTAVVLLLARGRNRAALVVGSITAAFLALYLAYAWAYDFRIFLDVIRLQGSIKWASVETFLDLLRGSVVEVSFGQGWFLWLLLSAGVIAFRKERAILIPLAIYMATMVLTADFRVVYGWYRIPLYPFLCVAAGIYLDEMIDASDLFRVFPFAATAVATGLLYACHSLPFAAEAETTPRTTLPASLVLTKGVLLLVVLAFLAPYLARLIREAPATALAARGATVALLIVFVVTSVATVGDLLAIYPAVQGARGDEPTAVAMRAVRRPAVRAGSAHRGLPLFPEARDGAGGVIELGPPVAGEDGVTVRHVAL